MSDVASTAVLGDVTRHAPPTTAATNPDRIPESVPFLERLRRTKRRRLCCDCGSIPAIPGESRCLSCAVE